MAGDANEGSLPAMLTFFRPPLFMFDGEGGGGGTATPPAPAAPAPGQTVPLDRFNDVIGQARTAERERDEARQRLQALEDEKKDEATRAKDAAEREKQRADNAERALAQTKRDYALRAAAIDAGAISPDAIVALANSRGVEIDVDKPDTIAKAIESMKGTDDAPGPDAKLFGGTGEPTPPAPAQRFGMPATPPAGGNGGNGGGAQDATDDPRLSIGRGLLAAINMRGGGPAQ